MKKPIHYSNEPIGEIRIINDFLPPPDALAFKEKKVKVTMSQASVDSFKAEAKKAPHILSGYDPETPGYLCQEKPRLALTTH